MTSAAVLSENLRLTHSHRPAPPSSRRAELRSLQPQEFLATKIAGQLSVTLVHRKPFFFALNRLHGFKSHMNRFDAAPKTGPV